MAQFNKNTHQFLGDGKSLFEVTMLADQYGNQISGANPTGMAVDAFGRQRMSQPFTLFDSFHRYQDNGRITTATSVTGATVSHNTNESAVICTLDTANGSYIKRESSRVFAYQPGKSLQIFETFVMSSPKPGLRQRYGFFGEQNGIFLEQDNENIYFVKRSYSSGSVVETKVLKTDWNVDKLDGTGPSLKTLDLTKAQILFIDIEWLGVGSVRLGFVIDGVFVHCHSFHHSNLISSTYMTTACLPIRAEIENTSATDTPSTLKIICATVISEGGYELKGKQRTVFHPIKTPYTLTTSGIFYPVVAIRLKAERLDAIVLPKNINILGTSNSGRYSYKIVTGSDVIGGEWISAGDDSHVEYNITGSSISGGNSLIQGYTTVSNQSAPSISLDGSLFRYQLERNSFTSTPFTFVLAIAGGANSDTVLGAIDWEEVT
jgi:hypothetical protein